MLLVFKTLETLFLAKTRNRYNRIHTSILRFGIDFGD